MPMYMRNASHESVELLNESTIASLSYTLKHVSQELYLP